MVPMMKHRKTILVLALFGSAYDIVPKDPILRYQPREMITAIPMKRAVK